MPQFSYRAINQKGRSVRGSMAAANEADLFQQLKALSMVLVDSRVQRETKSGGKIAFGLRRITLRDLIQMCLHLEQLQQAGVPLIEGLADVRDSSENQRLRDVLSEINRAVTEGASLSEAFGRHPRVFGPVFTALVSAGEVSGNMHESFRQLVKHLKWQEALNQKIKKATRYPSFIIVLMLGLFFFMMGIVVPEVVGFLETMKVELPALTLSLIATSAFVQDWWWAMLAVPVATLALFLAARRSSEALAFKVDSLLLRLPVLGLILRKIALSRFSHFFAIMFQAGVPILQCLETARTVVVNRALAAAVDSVHGEMQTGTAFSAALANSGQFPSLVIRMVRIGEDSGNLATTLNNVTEFYDRDVEESVDSLVAKAEPALTVVAGGLMLWIIVGVFGPVYGNLGTITG